MSFLQLLTALRVRASSHGLHLHVKLHLRLENLFTIEKKRELCWMFNSLPPQNNS
ncbi:hypothetical protein HanIR_Chr10g0485541 [Helianthus annuus]|nr:hypothetical protein HanIR_Chr10g0485541 [Helianthus annuus]